jgi:predicted nucleotidyltransferase component of viral defense system
MNEAVARMLERYDNHSLEDHLQALREILQEIALLGLWRSKFFDKAAFYGGTALRILYGLDRFSEDMDFSLLTPMDDFDLSAYTTALQKELAAFGFDVRIHQRDKSAESAVQSAFLKDNTLNQLLVIETSEELLKTVHRGQILKIKLEIDTDPPPQFETHTRYLLQPIPFAVRTYTLPDLFAGKMHAILCRRWKNRVKGRDWYDLVWYAANHPQLHLAHLEQRMRQSGHWKDRQQLTPELFKQLLSQAVDKLVVDQARKEVEAFIRDQKSLAIWSQEFFQDIADRIQPV